MTKEWLMNARLCEDLQKGISPRDKDDIKIVMESCCHFITEQFPNLDLIYQIVEVKTYD